MGDGKEKHLNEHIRYDYWISRHPVANAQYSEFVKAGGYADEQHWTEAVEAGFWEDGKIKGRFDNQSMKCKRVDFPGETRNPRKKPTMAKRASGRPAPWGVFQPVRAHMGVLTWRGMCGNGHGVFGARISENQILAIPMSLHPSGKNCRQIQRFSVCCGAARSATPRSARGAPPGTGSARTTGSGALVFGVCALPIPLYSDDSGLCYSG